MSKSVLKTQMLKISGAHRQFEREASKQAKETEDQSRARLQRTLSKCTVESSGLKESLHCLVSAKCIDLHLFRPEHSCLMCSPSAHTPTSISAVVLFIKIPYIGANYTSEGWECSFIMHHRF